MNYYIIGGDERSVGMKGYFLRKGESVIHIDSDEAWSKLCLLEKKQLADSVLILPVPVCRGDKKINSMRMDVELDRLLMLIPDLKGICGGLIPASVVDKCNNYQIPVYDFMKDDVIACKNAVATAEGAIFEAFMMSNINIENSHSLVLGFGRCGRVLAEKLSALRSRVTVMVRSSNAFEQALSEGFDVLYFKDVKQHRRQMKQYDFCFNSVPALVLCEPILKEFSGDIIILDIASRPGGTDFAYCREHGLRVKHSLGIPGRYSPKTSGEILGEAVLKYQFSHDGIPKAALQRNNL